MGNSKYEFRQSGQENYLVLFPKKEKVPVFELEYLHHREIHQMAPYEIMIQDGELQLWYCLTGCNSLETLLKIHAFGEEELHQLFKCTYEFCMELEKNLLNTQGAFLNLKSIFFCGAEKRMQFCYNPEGNEGFRKQMNALVEEMLTLIDYKNQHLVELLYRAYEVFNQPNGDYTLLFHLEKIENSMKEIDLEEMNIAEEDIEILVKSSQNANSSKENQTKERTSFFNTIKKEWNKRKDILITQRGIDWEAIKRKTKKKTELYGDFMPVVIKPESSVKENRTVFLGKGEERYCLIPCEGKAQQQPILLEKEQTLLGKNEAQVDKVLEGEGVSRLHAFILQEDGSYYLEDLNSKNGTFLNGERLTYGERVLLSQNDIIGIGGKSYCFGTLFS